MIEKHNYNGKNKEEVLEKIKEELGKEEQDLVLVQVEQKKTLIRKKEEYIVYLKQDINDFIKTKISEIIENMGLTPQLETKVREDNTIFTVRSDNNAILIGKNGRTINAIQTLIRSMLYKEINTSYNFTVDVSDYKQKNQARIERLAKYTARDVARSKVAVSLEPMNSYERRIIHSILSDSKDIETISEGEEPNRYVVIKPKGE
ncbi:MAG TPA: R3H domain-containing nucleic acid-binding protein [Bacilli bacterium]|nr:R3H domain-containing nucleic acid-binding protein [Bacilli bacterium]